MLNLLLLTLLALPPIPAKTPPASLPLPPHVSASVQRRATRDAVRSFRPAPDWRGEHDRDSVGRPPVPAPIPTGSGTDATTALQALLDTAIAATDADAMAGRTIRLPEATAMISDPLYTDGRNLTLAGAGPGSLLYAVSGCDAIAAGVVRLERQGLKPADYRCPSVLSPNNLRGLRTKGAVVFQVTNSALQLGGGTTPSGTIPDYYGAAAYTWEFVIAPGLTGWGSTAPLFGHVNGNGGPAPVCIKAGSTLGHLQFCLELPTQPSGTYSFVEFPTPGPAPWRVTVQIDGDAGTVSAWVGSAAQPYTAWTHTPTGGFAVDPAAVFPPGSRLARQDQVTPWSVGSQDGGCTKGNISDLDLHALAVTRGRKFVATAATLTRTDGQPVTDARFTEMIADNGNGIQTVACLPLYDAPKTHFRINTFSGSNVGYIITPTNPPASNLTFQDFRIDSAQSGIALGYAYGVRISNVIAGAGLRAISSIPIGSTYPVYVTGCDLGGNDCAAAFNAVILYASQNLISLTGRTAWLLNGHNSSIRDNLYTFHLPSTESYYRVTSNGYSSSLAIANEVIDNEDGGPSRAVVDMDHSPYVVNTLTVRGISVSTLAAPAFVLLNGRRTAATGSLYPFSYVDAAGLSVYAGMPSGATPLSITGTAGSWGGNLDASLLGVSTVAGDASSVLVAPMIPPPPMVPVP